jgi:hypothetical protein
MRNKRQIKIVLDDGGGLALAVYSDKYAHLYDRGSQLADDLMELLNGSDCGGWDNNEWGTGITSSDQSCRDYCGTVLQVIREIIRDYNNDNVYGANHANLAEAIVDLMNAK